MQGDHAIIPHLKADIELDREGPNFTTLNTWAADARRKLADRIEKNEFGDGWYDVHDSPGKPIGKIYVDGSGALL